jgi:hypothetical protein
MEIFSINIEKQYIGNTYRAWVGIRKKVIKHIILTMQEHETKNKLNILRTGDANLHLLRHNCERRMTQNCLLTRAWFLRT